MSYARENILLIGFMGSGKSSVARELERQSGRLFVDTDSLIELRAGMSVAEIFERYGEGAFREQEARLAGQLKHSLQGAIIATGGGMPLFCDLSSLGKIFFLNLPFEAILARLSPSERAKRPLFNDPDKARALFESRRDSYLKLAHHIIDAQRPPSQIALEILSHLA